MRMNPPTFLVSKEGKDPQVFLDGVYKLLSDMGVTSKEKAAQDLYGLRDFAQLWYTQWKDNRLIESGSIEWEEFKNAFLGMYLLCG